MLKNTALQKNRNLLRDTDHHFTSAFKALSDVNRYRIFRIIAGQPKLSVSDIAKILDISKPLTSSHLKVLLHAKLLKKERSGKNVYPRLERHDPFVRAIINIIKKSSR